MLHQIKVCFIFLTALAFSALGPAGSRAFSTGKPAPEITGGSWVNSSPLGPSELKSRVVLVEFWTFGCINCQNVIPYLRDWYEKYQRQGFIIVGVHSPEFSWEKPLDKVKAATEQLKIRYPVVQDNSFDIWKRYGVRAWPTMILIDKKGIIRYSHIGEGAYDKTEATIKQLLAEKN